MAHRPRAYGASRDPHDGPWCVCDRCGGLFSQNRLQFQYDFMGGSVPQNLGLLVCQKCTDDLNWQNKLLILPPDPRPIYNTRPEPYAVDETDWLTTQDGDILSTQDDDQLIEDQPNPSYNANTTVLTALLFYPGGSVASVYLDLFDGDPSDGGPSILATITGSATRTDIAASLASNAGVATNPDVLTVISAAVAIANVSYAALYDAPDGGNLLASGAVSATYPTIVKGAAVQFNALGLSIDLN